ncbi:GNAT family N-acetyltransferase [Streptomyces sp. NPDC048521]|uniref:GNAT family N-acetyltransferase n=1 Tax=Streptomyces sp. NPDC048521 TaxID=3365566 RepID=UPI0037197D8B
MKDDIAGAARAFQDAVEGLAAAIPGGFHERGRGGALLATTGSHFPVFNGVMSVSPVPDPAEIAALCEQAGSHVDNLPWSIRLRGEPGQDLTSLAARHGLNTVSRRPFMLLALGDGRPGREAAAQAESVRPLGDDEHEILAAVMGAAFGAPPAVITSLFTPLVLGLPFVQGYVAETDGVPATAGIAIRTGAHVGLVNIGTVPEHRGEGLGRAVAERILRDGHASGARTAYLHSTDEGLPLFERLGFRTEEFWTFYTR